MNIKDKNIWQDSIYLIDINDPVQGGEDGVDNLPHQQLADRTKFLKNKIDEQAIKINELENTISSLKNTNNSELQNQIDELRELIPKANNAAKTETVAYIQFSMIGTSTQNHHILQEIDKTGDISVQEITDLNTTGNRISQIRLPADFNKVTHRYLIHTQPLPYDNNKLEGTIHYTIVSDNDGSLVLNFHGSNTRAAYQTYVSTLVTIEVKKK